MSNGTNQGCLPQGWVYSTLGEVCSNPQYGWTTSASKQGEMHLLRTTDITQGYIDWGSVPFCKECPKEAEKYLLNDGDIVISRAGSVGYSHLVRSPQKSIFASYLIRFKPLINERYLGLFLKSPAYWKSISEKSVGIALANVNASKLKQIIIPIPPLLEQARIADKVELLFSFLDAGVASLRKVQGQLKRYRQAVLKAAFEGKLTQQWREKHKDLTKTATELGIEGASESEKLSLPLLPETWTWVHLDQITESMKNGIYKAKSFYDTKGCACLRMYNIENGVIVWKDIKRMKLSPEEIEEYGLNSDDILVNRVNSRELVGKSAVIPEGLEPCVYESKNIRLRLKNTLASSKYVNYWLLFFGQKYFNRNAQQVVGMASINQTQLGSLPLPFCSPLEQQQIIQEIDNHFSIADTSEKILQPTIQRIESLRQSILKEAFHGRLVPQNPADEPAERLLERIKAERLRNKSKNNQLELSKYVK